MAYSAINPSPRSSTFGSKPSAENSRLTYGGEIVPDEHAVELVHHAEEVRVFLGQRDAIADRVVHDGRAADPGPEIEPAGSGNGQPPRRRLGRLREQQPEVDGREEPVEVEVVLLSPHLEREVTRVDVAGLEAEGDVVGDEVLESHARRHDQPGVVSLDRDADTEALAIVELAPGDADAAHEVWGEGAAEERVPHACLRDQAEDTELTHLVPVGNREIRLDPVAGQLQPEVTVEIDPEREPVELPDSLRLHEAGRARGEEVVPPMASTEVEARVLGVLRAGGGHETTGEESQQHGQRGGDAEAVGGRRCHGCEEPSSPVTARRRA